MVSRDHTASPAAGLYNICYVNAFQAQEGAESEWDSDLLLRDSSGEIVYDGGWGRPCWTSVRPPSGTGSPRR